MNIIRWWSLVLFTAFSIFSYFLANKIDVYSHTESKGLYNSRASHYVKNVITSILQTSVLSSATVSLEAVGNITVPFFDTVSKEYISRRPIARYVYIQKIPISQKEEIELELSDIYTDSITIRPIGPSLIPSDDLWIVLNVYPFVSGIIGLELASDPMRGELIKRLTEEGVSQNAYNIPLIDTGEIGLLSIQPIYRGGEIYGATVSVFRYEIMFDLLFYEFLVSYPDSTNCVYIDNVIVYGTVNCNEGYSIYMNNSSDFSDIRVGISGYTPSRTSVFSVSFTVFMFLIACITCMILIIDNERNKAITHSEFKSRFLSDISHEIRTPMNGIMGTSELMKGKVIGSELLGYIETIHSCGLSLLDIINDVLDISSIESGNMIIKPKNVDIIEYIQKCVKKEWIHFKKNSGSNNRDIGLDLIIGEHIPIMVYCDEIRITQVISNLINNSLKFTPHGSVLVNISVLHLTISKCLLKFSVKDTGIGISKERVKHLFSPFSRGDATFGGCGLGLAISKGLCLLMGGDLVCVSEMGTGSEFSFTTKLSIYDTNTVSPFIIPYRHNSIQEIDEYIDPINRITCIEYYIVPNILVVDDISVNRLVLSKLLKNMGVSVDTCIGGQEAIDMCEIKKYSLIFMDMIMPRVDGISATISIRKNGLNKDVCIIFVTADVSDTSYDKCMNSGGTDHLTKPVSRIVLRSTLFKYLLPPEIECLRRNNINDNMMCK